MFAVPETVGLNGLVGMYVVPSYGPAMTLFVFWTLSGWSRLLKSVVVVAAAGGAGASARTVSAAIVIAAARRASGSAEAGRVE